MWLLSAGTCTEADAAGCDWREDDAAGAKSGFATACAALSGVKAFGVALASGSAERKKATTRCRCAASYL
jgi:hypothetical protein